MRRLLLGNVIGACRGAAQYRVAAAKASEAMRAAIETNGHCRSPYSWLKNARAAAEQKGATAA